MIKFEKSEIKSLRKNLEELKAELSTMRKAELNRITDRMLARVVKNTPVGDSPDFPDLRNRWERTRVQESGNRVFSEIFNPLEYASWVEFGHRQTPGRIVFIELTPGASKYGRKAVKQKNGKWGIWIKLKKSFVKGRFMLTDAETKAQLELDAAARRIFKQIETRINGK